MPRAIDRLDRRVIAAWRRRLKWATVIDQRIDSLGEFFAVIDAFLKPGQEFWFRGHGDASWVLVPSALRYGSVGEREQALALVTEFRRSAPLRLPREELPANNEDLQWLALAQHYGVPTRLLDWTENAAAALYFTVSEHDDRDGAVVILDPASLNELSLPARSRGPRRRILDAHGDHEILTRYLRLGARVRPNGCLTLALHPVLGTRRILVQKGAFTFHGSRCFALEKNHAPGLMVIPIMTRAKRALRLELQRIGVDRMTLFPEPEHLSRELRERRGL
jgi:FRG domain-containing protein